MSQRGALGAPSRGQTAPPDTKAATMPETLPIFGRIVRLAEHFGLTLRELAAICSFQRTMVYAWKTRAPTTENLVRLGEVTGVSIEWLWSGQGAMFSWPDPYPNRQKAMVAGRVLGLAPAALESLRTVEPPGGRDRPPAWWLGRVLAAGVDERLPPGATNPRSKRRRPKQAS